MSVNSFGRLFRVTTWGESHGPAIGCVIDGCPPGVSIKAADIQSALDERKPGTSKFVTQRREPDEVKILSGVFEDETTDGPRTTGTPISLLIENVDARSKDYADIREKYRPGHADFTYDAKYGFRDYRGGGRSSARETAARVAAGAVARLVLADFYPGASISAALVQIGTSKIDRTRADWKTIRSNPFWSPDAAKAKEWETLIDEARKNGSSLGAVVEVVASGFPAGLGAPVYGKLDADLSGAFMSINAVKAVEIGAGMHAAALSGEENADEIRIKDGKPHFLSNNAGGILGGISTGQDIVARFAVKPTSSILNLRRTITRDLQETDIVAKGRHDPCVGIRAVPVAVAMAACVILDHALMQRAQCGVLE